MQETESHKRLATIVAIDVAGYSARTEADQDASASEIAGLRTLIAETCARLGGRVFNTAGDGFMLEFPGVSDALQAAEDLASAAGPPIRVGVHLGEVHVTPGGDLLGHGVNVAARIQALAPPRGVWASADIKRVIRGPLADRLVDRGVVQLDKMDEAIQVYSLESVEDATAHPASAVQAPKGLNPVLARRGLIAGGVAVALGAAGFAGYRLLRPKPVSDPLVAVLPFDNLSPDPQLGYFADGLSQDILNALIKGGGVRVTSSTSSFTFRGAAKAKAGAALKADYLLDGSVLRDGSQLRVDARLNRVSDQQTLWSDSYDRDVGQGLQLEDEIAAKVTLSLKQQFMAVANAASQLVDPAAYDLYLRGRVATRGHSSDSIQQGGELLQQAVERAPNFASALYELANYHFRVAFVELPSQQPADLERARQAAARAFALDPRNGAAYGLLSQLEPWFNHWSEIDAILVRGLSISPGDADLCLWRGIFLGASGRSTASLDLLRRAQTLNPLELFPNHTLCGALVQTGQFDEALAQIKWMTTIWPNQLATFWDRFWLYVVSERWAEAKAMITSPQRPRDLTDEYAVYAQTFDALAGGSPALSQSVRGRLLDLGHLGLGYAQQVIPLLARLGFSEDALKVARSVYLHTPDYKVDRTISFVGSDRYPVFGEGSSATLFHPFLAPLRRAGRLNVIFDGMGLTKLWRQAGSPDA